MNNGSEIAYIFSAGYTREMRLFAFPLFFSILVAGFVLGNPRFARADTVSDIQAQIAANYRQSEALKAEIAADQRQLDALGTKKNTLQSTISSLTLSQKQLATQIKLTQNKIASANLKIKELTLSIVDKEATITVDQNAITKALRGIAEDERMPLIAKLISANSLSETWQVADQAIMFNRALSNDIADLRAVRTKLATNRDEVTKVKESLLSLNNDLAIQKKSVEVSKAAQQKLLADTKNQESSYQSSSRKNARNKPNSMPNSFNMKHNCAKLSTLRRSLWRVLEY